MSFDQYSDLPLIQPKKRTTKVNFGIVIGVVLFLVVSFAALLWYARNPHLAQPTEERAGQTSP